MKEYAAYLTIGPEVRFGKPCIIGTRIAVSDILNCMASGMSHQQILEDYPLLKEEYLRAALSFAANREAMVKLIAA